MSQLLLWLLIFATVNRASHAVVSYNLPHFCDEPAWNSTATTFADEYLVGTKPTGMFIDNHDTIYMTNQRDRLIHVWKNDMNRVILNLTDFKIKPISLVISQTGSIFVANGEEHTIRQILNITNDFRMMEVGHLCEKLFIGTDDNLYCSSPIEQQVLYRQAIFASLSWEIGLEFSYFPWNTAPKKPYGVFVDSASILYICDCNGDNIKTFEFQTQFGQQRNFATDYIHLLVVSTSTWLQDVWGWFFGSTNKLNCPIDIVADASENLYVVDRDNHRIVKFFKSERFECVVGCTGSRGSQANQLQTPTSLHFDTNGNMYVVDTGNNRIQRFNLINGSCDSNSKSSTASTTYFHSTPNHQKIDSTVSSDRLQMSSTSTENQRSETDGDHSSTITTSLSSDLHQSTMSSEESSTDSHETSKHPTSSLITSTENMAVSTVDNKETNDVIGYFIPRQCPNASYMGPHCNISQQLCDILTPCSKSATCINDPTVPKGYQCLSSSDENDDHYPCTSNPCRNNGRCEMIDKKLYRCECSPGWTDVHCDRLINHCENITCFNGAICRSTATDYECLCLTSSYSGRHCEHIETKLRIRQIVSKSFAYIAIISLALVFLFVIALDILKYCFRIDPTRNERRR